MPVNLELKAKITSPQKVAAALRSIGRPTQRLVQTDTYFNVRVGRLKLREFGKGPGELIFYRRNEKKGRRWSHYEILKVSNTGQMKFFLHRSFGVDVIVKKIRKVYIYRNSARIHVDKVSGLGRFLEFEVMHSGSKAKSFRLYRELCILFGVERRSMVRCSYSDLLRGRF
jgi:predicted adenylyl cyclase CyaB